MEYHRTKDPYPVKMFLGHKSLRSREMRARPVKLSVLPGDVVSFLTHLCGDSSSVLIWYSIDVSAELLHLNVWEKVTFMWSTILV